MEVCVQESVIVFRQQNYITLLEQENTQRRFEGDFPHILHILPPNVHSKMFTATILEFVKALLLYHHQE